MNVYLKTKTSDKNGRWTHPATDADDGRSIESFIPQTDSEAFAYTALQMRTDADLIPWQKLLTNASHR